MSSRLITLRNLHRRIAWVSLPPFIVLIAASLLVAQFTELSTKNEVLLLSSFIVLLSFSALALTATFFAWLKLGIAWVPSFLNPVMMLLHWLFFSFSMILFLIAIVALLRSVKAIDSDSR